MISYGHGIAGFIISIISLIHGLFASIMSCLIIIIIIYYSYNKRLKREEKTTLVLSINIYILMLSYSTILTSINIQALIGDIYGISFNSSACIYRGYFICVTCCLLYHAFFTQAFFRLCRIVYSRYRWLQLYWFYIINTPIQVVLASVLLSPLLILHDVNYLPNDFHCFVSFRNIRGIVYVIFFCYLLPLINLSLTYIRITFYLRQQPNNITLAIKRRQERDLLAIRRIFINVGLLVGVGVPGTIFLIMSFFTGIEHPLSYRVTWMGAEIAVAILSIEMVFITPQLRNIILKRWHQNQVIPTENSLQMRRVTNAQ